MTRIVSPGGDCPLSRPITSATPSTRIRREIDGGREEFGAFDVLYVRPLPGAYLLKALLQLSKPLLVRLDAKAAGDSVAASLGRS